jgi:hypothetical protein
MRNFILRGGDVAVKVDGGVVTIEGKLSDPQLRIVLRSLGVSPEETEATLNGALGGGPQDRAESVTQELVGVGIVDQAMRLAADAAERQEREDMQDLFWGFRFPYLPEKIKESFNLYMEAYQEGMTGQPASFRQKRREDSSKIWEMLKEQCRAEGLI